MRSPQPIIIQFGPRLNKEQIEGAFSVGPTAPWFQAVMEILDDHRHERAMEAAKFLSDNNALGAAGAQGAYDILTVLILDLESRRKSAQ